MCLTGVDYFSTLGLSTRHRVRWPPGCSHPSQRSSSCCSRSFGALPVYRRIAALSPNGQGSLSVLEERLPRWRGKALVLVPARLRRDGLHHHHHAVGGRRHGAHHREPVRARLAASSDRRHVRAARGARRRSSCGASRKRSGSRWLSSPSFSPSTSIVIGLRSSSCLSRHPEARELAAQPVRRSKATSDDDRRAVARGLSRSWRLGSRASRPASRSCRSCAAKARRPTRCSSRASPTRASC